MCRGGWGDIWICLEKNSKDRQKLNFTKSRNMRIISNMKIHKTTTAFIIFLIFFSMGADLLSIKVMGFTARISIFPLLIACTWVIAGGSPKIDKKFIHIFFLLFIPAALSVINSFNPTKSWAYLLGCFVVFLIMPLCLSNLIHKFGVMESFGLLMGVFRLLALMVIFEFLILTIAMDASHRPHLFFYEPSYAAIFFSCYFSISIFCFFSGQNYFKKDLIISFFALISLVSMTAIFGIMIGAIFGVLLKRRFYLFLLIIFFAALVIHFLAKYGGENFRIIYDFYGEEGLIYSLIVRGGNRFPRILWGLDAFFNYPITGVGLGADTDYSTSMPMTEIISRYDHPFSPSAGTPFVNPFIEALGTMGFMGIFWIIYCIFLFFKQWKKLNIWSNALGEKAVACKAIGVGFLSMFLLLQIEGTFLRLYVWVIFFHFVISADILVNYLKRRSSCYSTLAG